MDNVPTYVEFHEYRKNPGSYTLAISKQIITAIAVGIVIDRISAYIQSRYKVNPIIMIIIQILFIISVLYIIEKFISQKFADEWQNNTPGIFFVSFFFGLQFNLFSNLLSLSNKFSYKQRIYRSKNSIL